MKNLSKISYSQYSKKIFLIFWGCLISSVGTNLFIIPSKLLSSGVSGISLIIQYLTDIPMGYSFLVLNIPLLIVSYFMINKKFTFFTVIATVFLSLLLILTAPLSNILSPVPDTQRLLYCIYGGVLNGLGVGLVFTNEGSTGGMDIISMIFKKKYDIDVGSASFAINLVIVAIGAIVFDFQVGLYTLIVMYISSLVIDKVIKGFSRRKMLLIITNKEKDVSSAIINDLKRGVTILYGEGAYTGNKRNVMYCIVSTRQIPQIKKLIKEIDNTCFISIVDTSEVEGNGFKNPLGF